MIVEPLLCLFTGGTFRIFQKQHAHEQPFLELGRIRRSLCALGANQQTTQAPQARAQENHRPAPNSGSGLRHIRDKPLARRKRRRSPSRPRQRANRMPHLPHLTCAGHAAHGSRSKLLPPTRRRHGRDEARHPNPKSASPYTGPGLFRRCPRPLPRA